MTPDIFSTIQRREFLKAAGAATVFSLAPTAFAETGGRVSILIDGNDSIASGAPVKRAAERLQKALAAKGVACEVVQSADGVKGSTSWVVVAAANSGVAKGFPQAKAEMTAAESIRLAPGQFQGVSAILVSGIDQLGLIYGLLELAERVQFNAGPGTGLHLAAAIEEKPANEIRSVGRYFCCELEDKPWYYDKDFWRGYLDALVAARFNRFCFAYGLEYDFPKGVTGDYLHFPYPYLVDVPGYEGVRVMQIADPEGKVLPAPVPIGKEEKQKNFEMLRFIAAETGARGLHFQLGIWTHAYQWTDSPHAYHNIEGLTPETHAAYCRDALAIILKECPEIQGLTMRVHGESGIPEGSYPFWKTLFEAISGSGRTIEIDMHAKGVNTTMIDLAVATGMPVKLGAKYSAEQQSLGYNQTDIRALEIPHPGHVDKGTFSLSGGSRLFTRYGYADFLSVDARYKVLYRLWPGTQRHLLCADPEMAAAYGRTSHFCGAAGIDLMEPLTFKGREGSGHVGGRCAYADATLTPKYDWEKFDYYYRVWGRKLYDPEANAETWRRSLRTDFGPGALPMESAVANTSRILALLTSAHLPSGSNHSFWPELYSNMPIVIGSEPSPYGDTPTPKCFATVSPLDPQMFSIIVEHVNDLLAGNSDPRYSPIEVAQWMEDFAAASSSALAEARLKATGRSSPAFRRMEEDVLIQIGLGEFFGAKLRSGVLFEIYQQTGETKAGALALAHYQRAREAWATMATRAAKVYSADVSYGDVPERRGSWSDRLPAIDVDIEAMKGKLAAANGKTASASSAQNAGKAIEAAVGRPNRPAVTCEHTAAEAFRPGEALALALKTQAPSVTSVKLHYRHVNQGERWVQTEMEAAHGEFTAAIPADYTQSPYALQYYFELRAKSGSAWMYPAFNATLSNQPYYAISKRIA
jgi:hypothetical protein